MVKRARKDDGESDGDDGPTPIFIIWCQWNGADDVDGRWGSPFYVKMDALDAPECANLKQMYDAQLEATTLCKVKDEKWVMRFDVSNELPEEEDTRNVIQFSCEDDVLSEELDHLMCNDHCQQDVSKGNFKIVGYVIFHNAV